MPVGAWTNGLAAIASVPWLTFTAAVAPESVCAVIRISHMSDIDGVVTMPLTDKKGSRKPFTVKPLGEERAADKQTSPKRTLPDVAREKARAGRTAFEAWRDLLKPAQVQALRELEGELDRLMDEADTRDDGLPLDDDFPGFAPTAEEVA